MNIAEILYAFLFSGLGWGVILVAGRDLLDVGDRNRLMFGWFAITALLFTLSSGGLFLLLATAVLLALRMSGTEPIMLWVFLLGAAPASGVYIANLPFGISYLFTFSFAILLALVLGLPSLLARGRGPLGSGAAIIESFAIITFVLAFLLSFRGLNFTSGLREGMVWLMLTALPFYGVSRSLRRTEDVERVVRAFAIALVVMGVIGFGTAVIHWSIYSAAEARLFKPFPFGYLFRAGLMRSGGTLASSPISFGTMMAMGALLVTGLNPVLRPRWRLAVLFGACVLGLIGSVSRGPMVGLALGLIVYQLTRPKAAGKVIGFSAASLAVLVPFFALTPFGRSLYAFLPIIGTREGENIDYRAQLIEAGLAVFRRQPLFGSPDYLAEPEMQAMVQGQGIIDMVNSYLYLGLLYGVFVAAAFALVIGLTSFRMFRLVRRLPLVSPEGERLRHLGAGMLAALVTYGLTIATTSYFNILPMLGWVMIALCVAYIRTVRRWLEAYEDAPSLSMAKPATLPDPAPTNAEPSAGAEPAVAEPVLAPAATDNSFGLQTPWEHLPIVEKPRG